jgi:hypothetical protein
MAECLTNIFWKLDKLDKKDSVYKIYVLNMF